MCGIWGISGKFSTSASDDKFLRQCAMAGTVRGVDATGMIFLSNKKEVTYLKRAIDGVKFANEIFNPTKHIGNTITSVVGHNRAATIGAISDDTAHPFQGGHLIGVHNGTLTGNWRSNLQVAKNTDVDSRGLYKAIAARGIDWVIANVSGALALVWVDIKTGRTYVYRNAQRPLHYTAHATQQKVYYASEAGMLEWLLNKNNLAHKEVNSFKVNVLYEITGGEVTELRTISPPVAPASSYNYNYRSSAKKTAGVTSQTSASLITNAGKDSSTKQDDKSKTTTTSQRTTQTKENPSFRTGGIHGGTLRDGPSATKFLQKGVEFRGVHVSKSERADGITGEWAELGFEPYTCSCCNQPIQSADFLEADPSAGSEFTIHTSCLDSFRTNVCAVTPLMIIKRNPQLRGKVA